jgi:hypothetical protein
MRESLGVFWPNVDNVNNVNVNKERSRNVVNLSAFWLEVHCKMKQKKTFYGSFDFVQKLDMLTSISLLCTENFRATIRKNHFVKTIKRDKIAQKITYHIGGFMYCLHQWKEFQPIINKKL